MNSQVVSYLIYGQLSLYGFLTICTVLLPQFLFGQNQKGISNFGIHSETVIYYSLGFSLCAYYIWKAANIIPKRTKKLKKMALVLKLLSGLLIFALITTFAYNINVFLNNLHELSAVLLFLFELFIGCWIVFKILNDKTNFVLLSLELICLALGLFTLFGFIQQLFVAEIGSGVIFGLILIRAMNQLISS